MTNATSDTFSSVDNQNVILKLIECDPETLHMLRQDSVTKGEIMQDESSMHMLRRTLMTALLEKNQLLANGIREIFGLSFLQLINGEFKMGQQWFKIVIDKMKNEPETFGEFQRKWEIPDASIKYFGLKHLEDDVPRQEKEMIMKLTGITEEEVTAQKEEVRRKMGINEGRSAFKQAVKVVVAPLAEA